MTQQEKIQFINALIQSVHNDILQAVHKFPEEWDGFELRWYIAEKFQRCIITSNIKRKKEFLNFILVNDI